MKKLSAFLACVTLSACGGSGGGTPAAERLLGPPPITDAATLAAVEIGPDISPDDTNFASILNSLRVRNGLGEVSFDARLDRAAQKHAADMAVNNYFSHTSLDGREVLDRIQAEGYDPRAWGENIAGRQQDDQEALDAWINSPDHNRLLNADSLEDFALGVAGVGSQTRWVLLMATERNPS